MLNIPNEVKALFLNDSVLKNIRIHFPNGECEDVTNHNLKEESFSFTESICSEESLKFGLSEAAVVQFVTKGIGNIKGMEIQCQIEIDISSLGNEFISEYGQTSSDVPFPFYPVVLGCFTVKSCPKDSVADTESRDVKAYDKLCSQSLDYDKTEQLNNYFKTNPACVPRTVYTLEKMMLQDFNIGHERTTIPFDVERNEGTITVYEGKVLSADGSKDTSFEVRTMTFTIPNIESTEVYDVIFSNVGHFCRLHNRLQYYQKKDGFKLGANNFWWLNHGLEIEMTDINSRKVIFTEAFDEEGYLEDVLKILGHGNISQITFKVVSYINLAWNDEYGDPDEINDWFVDEDFGVMFDSVLVEKLKLYDIERKEIPSVLTFCTLRNVLNAVYEINGTFATINRITGMLEERKIGHFGLYPSVTLYPSEELFPQQASSILPKGRYSQARYDDDAVKPYGKIIAHYKAKDASGNVIDAQYEYVFGEGITYNLNSNWILQNCIFSETEVAELCAYMAERIGHITYTPCEITAKGLPWIETGDTVDVLTTKGGFKSVILRRTLTGIQGLIDDIESKGN